MATHSGPLRVKISRILRATSRMDKLSTWNIWKERNNFYFNGITPDCNSWKSRFKEDFALLVHRTKEDKHAFIKNFVGRL